MLRTGTLAAAVAGLAANGAAEAAGIERAPYGTTANGDAVEQVTLRNDRGVRVRAIGLGATLTEISVPDRDGRPANVVLALPNLAAYERDAATTYFGAVVGRYANRIAGGRLVLDGREYALDRNDRGNALHGGAGALSRLAWQVMALREDAAGVGATFAATSPDGAGGFPGTLSVRVTYTLSPNSELRLDYEATTDQPTVVALTNHSYFNLAGDRGGPVLDQVLQVDADRFTPTDPSQIPTGALDPVAGTPLDFRQATAIGARIHGADPQMLAGQGYDHNWVLNRPGDLQAVAARAYDPRSGRTLDLRTTEPGVQVYTANHLDGTIVGAAGRTLRQADAFTLETQHFPDSPNRPEFPSTVLCPGETYRSTTIFRFGTDTQAGG